MCNRLLFPPSFVCPLAGLPTVRFGFFSALCSLIEAKKYPVVFPTRHQRRSSQQIRQAAFSFRDICCSAILFYGFHQEPRVTEILVDNDLLIFKREEMLEERVIRCRSAKRFEERYLRKGFDEQISVIRILDSRREEFRLSKAYEQKIDVVNVITAPEIEMLIIHAEGAYDQFKRSGKKPSEFCKTNLRMHDVKSYDFVKQYFSNPQLLVKAIKEYRRTANIPKEEYSLSDLLR